MNVTMIRVRVRPESVGSVDEAVEAMFAALRRDQPEGVSYASCKLADGATYVILLGLEEGIENPLPAVAEFRDFQEALPGWLAEPPTPEQLTVVGSYNLF